MSCDHVCSLHWHKHVEMFKKLVGQHCANAVRCQRRYGEVAQVIRDNDVSARDNRSGEDVSVFGIIRHTVHDMRYKPNSAEISKISANTLGISTEASGTAGGFDIKVRLSR